VVITLSIVSAILVSKKIGWHKRVLYVLCGLAILSEVTKIFYYFSFLVEGTENGYYLAPEWLPFHLCSIQIIFIFMITFMKDGKVRNALMCFMYPTMMGGALMALLIPVSSLYYSTFFSVLSLQYWLFHGMLIFLSLYMIITKPIKFTMKSYFTAVIMATGACFMAIYLNAILGGSATNVNFFYVARPPLPDLPVLNLNHGWFVYMFHLTWLGILVISLTYTPVFVKTIKDWRNKRKGTVATSGR